ncbi:MAG: hypothetical protein ACUVQ0_03955 [Thermoproteota archaeon]
MGIEHEEGRRLLFRFVEDHPEYLIMSDPDLDGVFAASLTAKALETDVSRINYPKPSEIDSLRVSKSILIELPLSKGLTYTGSNILMDHHGSNPFVALYNGLEETRKILFNSGLRSVSRLVAEIFGGMIELEENGFQILEAIDQIDSGEIESELADKMNKAFLLNSMKEGVRKELTIAIYEMDWGRVLNWAYKESSKWNRVEEKIETLSKTVSRFSGIAYFTYNVADQVEAAARRILMLRLGKEFNGIVLCVGLKKGRPVSATISSRDLNLNRVYEELRNIGGVRAGGRRGIGGIQFKTELTVEDVLKMVQSAAEKIPI